MDLIDIFRKKINIIDDNIISLLNQRMVLSKQIGIIKKENNINILALNRENEIINRLTTISTILSKNDIESIYNNIFTISKNYQKK